MKVKKMPADSGTSILPLFDILERRVNRQKHTLFFIKLIVLSVVVFSALTVVNVSNDGVVVNVIKQIWFFLADWVGRAHNVPTRVR